MCQELPLFALVYMFLGAGCLIIIIIIIIIIDCFTSEISATKREKIFRRNVYGLFYQILCFSRTFL
jgi:phage-related holin